MQEQLRIFSMAAGEFEQYLGTDIILPKPGAHTEELNK